MLAVALSAVMSLPAAALGAQTETVTLRVDGMVCPLCEQTVESVVGTLEGVESVDADFRKATAVVTFDPSKVTAQQIAERINSETYYRARVVSEFVRTVALRIPGLDAQEEAEELARALRGLQGIEGGSVAIERLILDLDTRTISPQEVIETINERTAFTASLETGGGALEARSTAEAVIRVEGMTDQRTASQVTSALLLDGIVDGSVNLEEGTLSVVYDPARLTPAEIVAALERAAPGEVSLLEGGPTGGILSSPWPIVALVGLVVLAVLAWPRVRSVGGRRARPRKGRAAPSRR